MVDIIFISAKIRLISRAIGLAIVTFRKERYLQDVVFFLTTLSSKFDPLEKAKSLLDKLSHPAKIR